MGITSGKRRTLAEYQAKRNFHITPEPRGKASPPAAKRAGAKPKAARTTKTRRAKSPAFCVQKHLASSLHYDFRLEHDGVLLSWAVPKGPSLDPRDKRLAMRVEDHPMEYKGFEGVIPEGYGAGIVLLWDEGTWRPLVDDVEAALERGELKFELDGYKLKGSWVLVRTGGQRGGGRAWLLIKHRDDWSGEIDITQFAPESVRGSGDLADVLAQESPPLWESHRPEKGGAAGKLLRQVIEEAARIKSARRPWRRTEA